MHFLFTSETFRLFTDNHCSLCFEHTHILIRGKITKVEKMNFALSDLGLLIAGGAKKHPFEVQKAGASGKTIS